jgi:hypothetical protein
MRNRRQSAITPFRIWARQNVIIIVLSAFILLSTLLNALTLGALYRVRDVLRAQLNTATQNVAQIRTQTVHYDFPIKQSFPISTTIDIDETLNVPVNMKVPIRQQVTVPVGPVSFPVDLNFDVPISTTFPVKFQRQIPVRTNIDLNTTIPIDLDLKQGSLGDVLRKLEESLRQLLAQL